MAHGALPLSPPPSSLEQRVLHSVVVTKVIFSPVYACCVFVCVGEEDDEGHGDEDDSEGEVGQILTLLSFAYFRARRGRPSDQQCWLSLVCSSPS